jgi:nicotinate-nucleotide pyrophosphorylase (carboxylating)
MAKVWIASGGEKGYEEAFRLGKRVLEISRNEPDDCGSYEADSLRLMINVSILEGRADKNLTDEKYHEAIALIDGKAEVELSGNFTLDNIERIRGIGADYVSCGALTHSAPILDLSLKHLKKTGD